jgi:adenylosuccinate lyase
LAHLGHPDAHAKVRQLTLQAQQEQRNFSEIIEKDTELAPYLEKMTPSQKKILSDPTSYTGLAFKKAVKVANEWAKRLDISIQARHTN